MSLFKTYEIIVRRFSSDDSDTPTGGSYIRGEWVPSENPMDEFTLKVSRQPASGKDMQTLPEGKRARVAYKYFTDVALYTTDPVKGRTSDQIIDKGEIMEVVSVASWQNGIIPHYEVIAVRLKEGE